MIRDTPASSPRLGSISSALCPDPWGYASQLNPACWEQWAAANSSQQMQTDCSRAAGGSTTSDLYQRCVAQMTASVQALKAQNPDAAADYAGVTGSDPLGYLFGLTTPDAKPKYETWAWLAVAAIAALVLYKEFSR